MTLSNYSKTNFKGGETEKSNSRPKHTYHTTEGEFISYLLTKGYGTSTAQRYVQNIKNFMEWATQENLIIDQVRNTDILGYIQSKKEKLKQRSISSLINSIKHYYNHLKAIEIVGQNPAEQIQLKGIKRKILYDTLTHQELETLYSHFGKSTKADPSADKAENNPDINQNWYKMSQLVTKRNKVILGLIVYQGLGTRELKNLTEKDLKLREGQLYIQGTRRSNERVLKFEPHQVLDIMEYVLQVRKELLTLTNSQSNMLFISAGKSEGFNNAMQQLMKKLKAQNTKITSLQQIRTSVISHWLKHYNLREVQYRAGHKFLSSTEAYKVNDLEGLIEDIEKYHPI